MAAARTEVSKMLQFFVLLELPEGRGRLHAEDLRRRPGPCGGCRRRGPLVSVDGGFFPRGAVPVPVRHGLPQAHAAPLQHPSPGRPHVHRLADLRRNRQLLGTSA
eukprot:2363718-Heterocapsa_arctica.AAC.1